MSNKWFGKQCRFLSAQWEENKTTGGENYQENEPILKYCNHPKNGVNVEGNCDVFNCPILPQENREDGDFYNLLWCKTCQEKTRFNFYQTCNDYMDVDMGYACIVCGKEYINENQPF